jgi:hypothetical protein
MVTQTTTSPSLTMREVEDLNKMTDEEIGALSDNDVHTLVSGVSEGALKLQAYTKGLDKFFDRIKKLRLLDIIRVKHHGQILEYPAFVLRVSESKPTTPYKDILAALVKERPELKEIVNDITKTKLSAKKPTSRVNRYTHEKEPKTWKEIEHTKIDLSKAPETTVKKRLPRWIVGIGSLFQR